MKQLVFTLAALSSCLCVATVDIPFWGQENPPLERPETASATWDVPAGFDFRVFSQCFSDVIGFYTGKLGIMLIVR